MEAFPGLGKEVGKSWWAQRGSMVTFYGFQILVYQKEPGTVPDPRYSKKLGSVS